MNRLGQKSSRTIEELSYSQQINDISRAARREFLGLHVEWLYEEITENFHIRKTLRQVAYDAARRCPGLVPTEIQMDGERTKCQATKEGYEIDQGLLFSFLLRSLKIGKHMLESSRRPTSRASGFLDQFRRDSRLDLGPILLEKECQAAHITINNGYCLNAEDANLVDAMETAVDITLLDEGCRIGILRGGTMSHPRYLGKRVFSAGINLKALHAGQIPFVDFILQRELGYISKIMSGLFLEDKSFGDPKSLRPHIGKPWMAIVESFAIGGGAQILLAVDRVIAANDSYFSLPAAKEGIVPGFANLRLTRSLGGRKARQVLLSGLKIFANSEEASLVFDEVVEPSQIEASIARSVQELSSNAVCVNRHMLNLAEEPLEHLLRYAAEFALLQAERLYSPDVLQQISRV
jgi:thioesterase DpgC